MTTDTAIQSHHHTTAHTTTRAVGRRILLFGTPLLLGTALLFHSAAGEDLYRTLDQIAATWLLYHVLLLPLFGLLGICLYVLIDDYTGRTALLGQLGVAIYLISYTAFEAIAGIATGLLAAEAQPLAAAHQAGVATALEGIQPAILPLALVGTAGAVIAVAALAHLLRRNGAPLIPVTLLAGAPLTAFTHGGTPIDAVGMLLFLGGVIWLEMYWTPPHRPDANSQS